MQDRVQQPHHGLRLGGGLGVGAVHGLGSGQGLLEGVLGAVVLQDGRLQLLGVRHDAAHRGPDAEGQVLEHGLVEGVGERDHQVPALEPQGQHAEGVRDALVHQGQGVGIRRGLGEIDAVEAGLLREGAGHGRLVGGPHGHQELPEESALLALLRQGTLDVGLADRPVVLEDLPEHAPPLGGATHRRASRSLGSWA